MNSDGSGAARLTSSPGYDGMPSPSPDRSRIAFTTNRDTVTGGALNFELYVMSADGSGQRRLTNHPGTDWEPHWSPAGDRIVFSSTRDGDSEIFVVNADGTGLRQLTFNDRSIDRQPQFSPDGAQIAFMSDRHTTSGGSRNIYVMNADGSNVRRITSNEGVDENPSWSPSGGSIAFDRELADRDVEVFVVNVPTRWWEVAWARQVTSGAGTYDGTPTWDPNGGRLAYSSSGDIKMINVDGTGVRTVSAHAEWEGDPFWQKPAQQPTNA